MGFRVISKPRLKDFWETHSDSQQALEGWYKALKKSKAENFAELKETFSTIDLVQPDYIIFNIKGNRYRIITRVHFAKRIFWIKHVFTHADYDRWKPEEKN